MEVKKGFKQTEIGIFPIEWREDKICNIALISTGAKNTQDRIDDGEYPFFVRSQTIERINSYSFDGEAILTAGDGVGTGKTYHYINGRFDFHQRVYKISNFCKEINGYFFFLFFSTHFYDRIMSMTAKSSVDSVRREMISDMIVPLPPLPEQLAIAEALSDVDALIISLEALITKKRAIKQGVMQELLTGRQRLQSFIGVWKTIALREIVKQFIVPMRDKPKVFSGNIPWCRIEDFDGTYLADSKSNQCVDQNTVQMMNLKINPIGTLLVSCSANLGKCAIVKKPLVTNQTFIGLVFDNALANNVFYYYYFQFFSDRLNTQASGTTISYLSRDQFEQFEVYVPREIHEQHAIAECLSNIDSEILSIQHLRIKYENMKKGMMQELLTGRIRLVGG